MLLMQCGKESKGLSNANASTFTKMTNFHYPQVNMVNHQYSASLLNNPPLQAAHPHLQQLLLHDSCSGATGNVCWSMMVPVTMVDAVPATVITAATVIEKFNSTKENSI